MNYEVLGTIASIIVLISFLMKDEKGIRRVNIIGALIFTIYGLGIGAFSVWFLNGMLFIIHIYKLGKMRNGVNKYVSNRKNSKGKWI